MHIKKPFLAAAVLLSILMPSVAYSADAHQPYRQEFVITAYYSPKQGQCCYVRGSYEADIVLNGNGTNGASGKEVHPGMAAAPKLYPFGTRITLPGIGTVTVQDRGGAINTQSDGTHRLDLWMGEGEEGLARALAFGVQRMTGTVFLPGTNQPPESFALANHDAPWNKLSTFLEGREILLSVRPKKGDRSQSTLLLQQDLHDAGFLRREPTGFYGPETEIALKGFAKEFHINGAVTELTRETAATLLAAVDVKEPDLLPRNVNIGSAAADVRNLQRLLRYLGFYKGRTDGIFDVDVRRAVLEFQLNQNVIASRGASGAGTAGPRTRMAINTVLREKRVAQRAKEYLLLARIDDLLRDRDAVPSRFLAKGETSDQVRLLQRLLAERGFLPANRATGFFGDETRKALLAYQLSAGIIKKTTDPGAGFAGPATRHAFLTEIRSHVLSVVRASGWGAI